MPSARPPVEQSSTDGAAHCLRPAGGQLADDGLREGGHDGQAGLIKGHAAIDMVLHHHDGDEHDGGGHATEHEAQNAETATVGHNPLPKTSPSAFCRSRVNFGSISWVKRGL